MTTNLKKIDKLIAQAINHHELGQLDKAQIIYFEVLKLQPQNFSAIQLLGAMFAQTKNYSLAIEYLTKAIQINPYFAPCYNNIALVFFELNRFDEALFNFNNAINVDNNYLDAHFNRGNTLLELKQFEDALASYDKAINIHPGFIEAYFNQGQAYHELKLFNAAMISYRKVINLNTAHSEAYYNLGKIYQELKQFDAAIGSYNKALDLRPDFAEAYFNRGNTFQELKQFVSAITSYNKAIDLKPDFAEAYCNRGRVFHELNQLDQAKLSYKYAIDIKPNFPEAHFNNGQLFHDLKQFNLAIDSYSKAIELKPDFAEAYCNIGNIFSDCKKIDASIEYFDKAISIRPNFEEAYFNRGNALVATKKFNIAIESYSQALNINAEIDWAPGALLFLKMQLGDWSNFKIDLENISKKIVEDKKVVTPLALLAMNDNPILHMKAAEIFVKFKCSSTESPQILKRLKINQKIRIAYISPDFRTSPVGLLTAELFETHNRDRFEILAFSLRPSPLNDELCIRLKKGFDKFIDVSLNSDLEVSQLSRDLGIDIAIDLAGHTESSRPGIFYNRAAPIQVNWLGYPGTSGAPFIDYVISDKVVTPSENRSFYSEKIAYLSNSLMVDDSTRIPSSRIFSKEECALPKNAFVFCCFNNHFKFNEELLDSWSKILSMASNSVLWIPDHGELFSRNIQNQFFIRGIDSSRIIFAKRMDDISDHLARIRLADLFLDTRPYNAHTSSLDSLKGGVPVLTLMGKSHASRIAASILKCIGLEELITTSRDEYENLAIHLATHPEKIITLKNKLAINLNNSPLFDTPLFAKNIESLYEKMYERYQSNLEPDHINEPA
jgi:protein O-GlcNAc transferase